jgi:hypothetical protein
MAANRTTIPPAACDYHEARKLRFENKQLLINIKWLRLIDLYTNAGFLLSLFLTEG